MPFGRGLFLYGETIRVNRDADEAEQERARLNLQDCLHRLTAQAEERLAHRRNKR